MKKLKTALGLLLMTLCIAVSGGCTTEDKEDTETSNANSTDDERSELLIYYLEEHPYFGTALGTFIASHHAYDITLEPFQSVEELQTRLSTEIAAGKGPDVVLLSYGCGFDMYKAIYSGNIADMSSYFEEDKKFMSENYHQAAMDGGKFFGGQYVVPFTFSFESSAFQKSVLDSAGYSSGEINDFSDVTAILEESLSLADNDTLSYLPAFGRSNGLARLLTGSGISVMDEDGNLSGDIENMKIIMELIAAMQDEFDSKTDTVTALRQQKIPACESILSVSGNYPIARLMLPGLLETAQKDKGEFVVLPWKNVNGKVQPILYDYGFVNQSCKDKEAAYTLLRVLMDYEPTFGTNYPLPVNKVRLEKKLDRAMLRPIGDNITLNDGSSYELPLLDEETRAEIEDVLENMDTAILYDTGYYSIITDRISDYVDTRDMDTCFDDMKSELDRYLRE